MAVYVLIHGAFHGGWCWRDVAAGLRARGHDVFTPTLTGLGAQSHLLTPGVDLDVHIQDVTNLLQWEDLTDVTLVGHSYGGMVVTGVADRAADRIADIVYLDAIVPENGQSTLDVQPPGRADWMRARAAENGGVTIPPVEPELYGVTEPDAKAWVAAKCTPQPFQTFSQKIRLSGPPAERVTKRLYILCTNPALPYMQQFYERAASANWEVMEMATGHDAMVTAPDELTDILASRA